MNRKTRIGLLAVGVLSAITAFGYNYKVLPPAKAFRPQWSGAKPGVWTMDYEAAAAKAKANGKLHIMMLSGSWWCPYCQNFEAKVGLSEAWKKFIEEKGCYLSFLDYPYRFPTPEDQLFKSRYPEMGDGWGFECWLYDPEYLAEYGVTQEEGFQAIQKFYQKQGELADATAEQFVMSTWNGLSTFTYGKVAYPMLVVYLPDGTEAGRVLAAASIYKMTPEDAQKYVIGQIEEIVTNALNAQCGLCSDPEADECGFTGAKAQQYNGWLSGEDGLAGLIEVKTSKINHRGTVKVKAVVNLNGRKVALEADAANGCESVQLQKKGAKNAATLRIGAYGLYGTYTDGISEYTISGARNVFVGNDVEPESKKRAAALPMGAWSFGMRSEDSGDPLAGGFGALTIEVKAKGRARIKGRLGDGTNVSVAGQMIAGEDGVFCLPVCMSLYGKKGGLGCNLWFRDGWLINVTEVSRWRRFQKGGISEALKWTPFYTALPGPGTVAEEMELLFNDPPIAMKGDPLVKDPEADTITTRNTGWKGTDESSFYARFAPKTAVFSGSMIFYSQKANGRIGRTRATVYGVTIGGTGYGTVTVKNVGNWAVKVSACAACED